MNKYFPLPIQRKKKSKKSVEDETFIRPLTRTYSNIVDNVPSMFLQSSSPSLLGGQPTLFTNPTDTTAMNLSQQRERNETTIQTLIGQQELLQDQLDITNVGNMETLKSFISMYSDEIRPELKEQYFGRGGSLPVSAITEGLRGLPTPAKRNILTDLVSQHDLANDYLTFHREHTEMKQRRREEDRGIAESSRMAEARSRTTRHSEPRQDVSLHDSTHSSMSKYIHPRGILDDPGASVNPLFTGGDDSGLTETE